ncbi:MAG: alpha/beta hydrolase fold domain-containing protein [Opitutaceae bacterium]|nr:alpha/beta hydrolase fold domain-containing protein [Opitutaceae bacterium]
MPSPLRPFLAVFAALSLSIVCALAQAQEPTGAFGPWLDSNRDEPAGMKYRTFTSKLAATDVSYLIYLPPGYEANAAQRYPVVYWLHGRGGSQTGAATFASRLDAVITSGKAPGMIVIGVNGRKISSWVDAFDGKSPLQSVIVKELIPHIDDTYRTIAKREARAIEGFSMGGAGAPKIGFKYPELFGAVGVVSGALHDLASYSSRGTAFQDIYGGNKNYFEANDPWNVLRKNADAIRGRIFVRVAVGGKDNLLEKNTAYHELLTTLKIEHEFDVVPEAVHNPGQVYDGLGDKTWAFYTRAFGRLATQPAAATPAIARGSNEAPNAWTGVGTIEGWRTFTVKTEDGHETPAIWAAPDGPGPFPAVVWFHGAPPAQGERGERNEANRGRFDLFLKAGFVVCLGDYRGEPSAGSGISGVDDAAAIIRHVKTLPRVDPQRVAAMGHSLGGATAFFAATREPVACVVDSAAAAYAVLDMPMGSLRGKPAGGELPEDQFNRAHAGAILNRINAPTLILYGESDPLSRINKTIYDLMKGLGKNVRLETFAGEHHGMLFRPSDRERGLRAWTTMVEFVSSILLPPTSAKTSAGPATAAPVRSADAPPRVPAGTKVLRDLAYVSKGHERQKLDLYLPEKSDRPLPLVVWIHGGGWAAGDKREGGTPVNAGYPTRGYAVASLNYRLSGDAIFPAQIEDCKAAIRWLRAHAKDYKLDPTRIGVWGTSAGGHLVALLGATGGMREFDVGENLDQSSSVEAVCDYFGPTDLLQMDAHALPGARLKHDAATSPESRLVGGPIQEKPFRDRAARVNPIPYLTRSAPPHLIVHGDQDPLVPHHQSQLLFAALKQTGVPVRFHTIKGAGHGVGFGGREVSEMVGAFFDHHLLDKQTAAADWPIAMTSESAASAIPPAPAAQSTSPAASAPAQPNNGKTAPAQGQRPTWDQILAREDADHDGKITREEFKGPPPLFSRLDRNGDGVLTKEEFESAGAPR